MSGDRLISHRTRSRTQCRNQFVIAGSQRTTERCDLVRDEYVARFKFGYQGPSQTADDRDLPFRMRTPAGQAHAGVTQREIWSQESSCRVFKERGGQKLERRDLVDLSNV